MTANFELWWQQLIAAHKVLADDEARPLWHIEQLLASHHLAPSPDSSPSLYSAPECAYTTASFDTVSHLILLNLRADLYSGTHHDRVEAWAEKLMRFCEIRLRSLRERSLNKCGGLPTARKLLLHIQVFFLDWSQTNSDLRFLNTALKMSDLSWLLHNKTGSIFASKNGDPIVLSALHFRIALANTCLLDKLRRDQTA
jgi:hypothetical protein